MAELKTNKADAARRQLDACIRMFFNREDPLAVHTVVSAAFQILRDLAEGPRKSNVHEIVKQMIRPERQKEFWAAINKNASYLKHADRDPDAALRFTEEDNDLTICGACIYYESLGYQVTHETRVFMRWCIAKIPTLSTDAASFENQFPDLESFRRQPRQAQMEIGRKLLAATRGKHSL